MQQNHAQDLYPWQNSSKEAISSYRLSFSLPESFWSNDVRFDLMFDFFSKNLVFNSYFFSESRFNPKGFVCDSSVDEGSSIKEISYTQRYRFLLLLKLWYRKHTQCFIWSQELLRPWLKVIWYKRYESLNFIKGLAYSYEEFFRWTAFSVWALKHRCIFVYKWALIQFRNLSNRY